MTSNALRALEAQSSHAASTEGPSAESPYLYVREAARYLRVDPKTIHNMISDGRLAAVRSGRNMIRLRRADVEAVMVPFGGGA